MDLAKWALACTLLVGLSGNALAQCSTCQNGQSGGYGYGGYGDYGGGYGGVDGPLCYGAAGGYEYDAPPPGPMDVVRSHCAMFYGGVDGMFLRYRTGSNQPIALNNATGQVQLDVGDLNFDYEPAAQGTVGMRLPGGGQVEGTYLYVAENNTNKTINNPAGMNLAFGGFSPAQIAVSNYFGATRFRADYESDIEQVEANYFTLPLAVVGPWVSLQGMLGLRYVDLEEQLVIYGTDAGGTSSSGWVADNQMYGGQAGVRVRGEFDLFSVEFNGKAGLYDNHVRNNVYVRDVNNTVIRQQVALDGDSEAFVGELSLIAGYQMGGSWMLRGGYIATVYEQVATAPGQIDLDISDGYGSVRADGTVLLHGFIFGLFGTF